MKFTSILVAPLFICGRSPAVQARTDRRSWDDNKRCKAGDLDWAAWRLRLCRRYRKPKTGAVQGIVFATDADGGRYVVPGAKLSMNGPTPSETSLTPKASSHSAHFNRSLTSSNQKASGMTATQVVAVTAGASPWMVRSTDFGCIHSYDLPAPHRNALSQPQVWPVSGGQKGELRLWDDSSVRRFASAVVAVASIAGFRGES